MPYSKVVLVTGVGDVFPEEVLSQGHRQPHEFTLQLVLCPHNSDAGACK